MESLAQKIKLTSVPRGSVAIYMALPRGFVFKDSVGSVVCIDPYFSDVVERECWFKRMTPCPMPTEELDADR